MLFSEWESDIRRQRYGLGMIDIIMIKTALHDIAADISLHFVV